ncbi:unnamed protein product [Cylindrotheca closterium]|uniref:Uncharacterized protein n=1 Tax=Cylindrotheca closterium TaxID=2856 RepID=A0AAD2FEH4_9STRA|nr:unnamed protein product [Cylindrotheca closterium]
MGQQQSQEHTEQDSSELLSIDQQIQRLRQDLLDLKQEGQTNKQRCREELKRSGSELNDSLRRFHACDREATSLLHFGQYLEIIKKQKEEEPTEDQEQEQQEKQSRQPGKVRARSCPSAAATQSNTPASNKNVDTRVPSVGTPPTALSKSSLSMVTNQVLIDIVRIFQAHLLRKLHMGLMWEKQSEKHAKGWNKIVLLYYNRAQEDNTKILGKEGSFTRASRRVSKALQQGKAYQQEKLDLTNRILTLQQEILERLRAAMPRRSSIKDMRKTKRELEMLRYSISPYPATAQDKKLLLANNDNVNVTTIIQMMPSLTDDDDDDEHFEESKEDREDSPELFDKRNAPMRRRSSIEDIKARNRELELRRTSSASPTNEDPTIVAI